MPGPLELHTERSWPPKGSYEAPTSNFQGSFKNQAPKQIQVTDPRHVKTERSKVANWILDLLRMLDVRAWIFFST